MVPIPNFLMIIRGVISETRWKYKMTVSSFPADIAFAQKCAKTRVIVVALSTGTCGHVDSSIFVLATLQGENAILDLCSNRKGQA